MKPQPLRVGELVLFWRGSWEAESGQLCAIEGDYGLVRCGVHDTHYETVPLASLRRH